jgi:MraZ protein
VQFLGEHEVPVDAKGRVFIPAEFRKKLPPEAEDTFVVLRGLDGCLTAYPQHVWAEIAKKMMRLPPTEQKSRIFVRSMLSQAAEVKLDRQGRVLMPRKLLDRVGIKDAMIIIGALDKLEIWEPGVWSRYIEEAEPVLEEVAESLDL